ncbi:MAG: hypothetical protein NT120_00425 [Candidatus Aenigmarchaeota archaeon]|nr:hypothetical protein [Candidatus Aenigmarchaeota archaeon]
MQVYDLKSGMKVEKLSEQLMPGIVPPFIISQTYGATKPDDMLRKLLIESRGKAGVADGYAFVGPSNCGHEFGVEVHGEGLQEYPVFLLKDRK